MISKLDDLLELAKKCKTKTLAIAAAEDIYAIKAIKKAKELGLITPIFIGNSVKIKSIAEQTGLIVSNNEVINTRNSERACNEAVEYAASGQADIIMKGLVPSKTLLKFIASKKYGLRTNNLLSHIAIFELSNYHKLLGISDAAMNISPSIKEKVAIIYNAVDVFIKLGIKQPKVALLTAIEKVNPKMQSTIDADSIVKMLSKRKLRKCIVDGPLALDNAISKDSATHKGIISDVAGNADILITPDLQSGNILYKSFSFLGNAKSASIITGGKCPVVVTSRSDSAETKLLSITLGVLTST